MSKIRVLPEILAGTIAAGEIVERPASVVKELVENALDAGAHALEVTVEAGGKRQIRVRDDGEGMNADDALLAFEHHATSKIRSAEDLRSIATLGFRGEALPSIAAVSRLELRTRAADAAGNGGTEVVIHAGTVRSVKPIAWDRGTEVAVRDLFFNLPARRKFLRTGETEAAHVTRLVTQYALSRPGLRVRLVSDGRAALDAAPVPGLRERAFQLFGDRFLDALVAVEGRRGELSLSGFTSHPREQRTSAHWQFFFVNGRMVRDRVVTSAVRQAYRHTIPAAAYPIVVLFLDLPYDEVDVNAHPSKLEVRFRDAGAVHDLVRESLSRAIGGVSAVTPYRHHGGEGLGPQPSLAPAAESLDHPPTPQTGGEDLFRASFAFGPGRESSLLCRESLELFAPAGAAGTPANVSPGAFAPGGARILGQMHDSYIVAADREGLVIVDQHAAHERVLYERNAEAMRGRGVESQLLVEPLPLELSPAQRVVFEGARAELERHGFVVEPFGGGTFLVRSVPAMAREADCRKLLLEIVEGLELEERTLDAERLGDRIAVNLACRAAIKVHTPLAPEKMQWLLDALARTRVPTHCPHGRPGILRFTLHEIERNFRRI